MVVAYINKQGSTYLDTLISLSLQIFRWSEKIICSISAVHAKGSLNVLVNYQSRVQTSNSNWELNQEVFRDITSKWGYLDIDLFSSRQNRRVESFFPLVGEPSALMTDELAHLWNFNLANAFPPVALLPLMVRKIIIEQVILLAPWCSRKSWFSALVSLSVPLSGLC